MEKKILIITYDMIPHSSTWGAAQRMYFLASHLTKKNHDVTIFHVKNQHFGYFGHELSFKAYPVTIPNQLTFFPFKKESFNDAIIHFISSRFVYLSEKSKNFLLKTIFNEPNPIQGYFGLLVSINIKLNLFSLIKKEKFDVIIISSPPFSLFILANLIKSHFPFIKVILDYRDPWNIKGLSPISSLFEKRALRAADRIVFVNNRIRVDTCRKFHVSPTKTNVILNGFSEQDWRTVKPSSVPAKEMIISYIGSVSLKKTGYRSIYLFLDTFFKFTKSHPSHLKIVGHPVNDDAVTLMAEYSPVITVIPPVSHVESLSMMLESDVLLISDADPRWGKYILTGKFFDYIRSGKVIMGIGANEDTYFLELINQCKLGIGCISAESEIMSALEFLFSNWEKGTLNSLRKNDPAEIRKFSRELQNERYIEIVEKIHER